VTGRPTFPPSPIRILRYDSASDELTRLERLIEKRFEPLSHELLARVTQGALDSPQTPDKVKAALK